MKQSNTSPAILVVEDDSALNDAFCIILRTKYPHVHGVYNGKDALTYLKDHPVGLIFLDILMPVMDGRDFLKHFTNPTNIPVVVLSNLDARTDIESLTNLGANSYILKSSASPLDILATASKYLP